MNALRAPGGYGNKQRARVIILWLHMQWLASPAAETWECQVGRGPVPRWCAIRHGLLALSMIVFLWPATSGAVADSGTSDFADWLDGLRREASEAGISAATLDAALTGLTPLERVIELDRRQPEFTRTFWGYLDNLVTEERVEQGRDLLWKHRKLLERVRAKYGVPPRFLVAFWGLESAYGRYTGELPVVAALATLAHDRRRSDFFRAQLLDTLRILDSRYIALNDMKGSWAGAMGQLQFMPSTFLNYAVDADQDGRRDIWTNFPDIFASAANYLNKIGWRGRETWGREVRLPKGFDFDLARMDVVKPVSSWQALGVRRADGRNLPRAKLKGSIVLPAGHKGPAFLVYGNFQKILIWNRSLLYALAVGHLADRLAGQGPLVAQPPPGERPLQRTEVIELQTLLAVLGFDPGTPDGIAGTRTRAAIRAYQKQASLPADGHPSADLLSALRQKSGK